MYDTFPNMKQPSDNSNDPSSFQLFKSLLGYSYFVESSWILFLNKKDLFAEKIQTSNLVGLNPKYS